MAQLRAWDADCMEGPEETAKGNGEGTMPATVNAEPAPAARLEAWVETLDESDVPVLARTARDVGAVTGREDASAAELAAVVLRDAPLTARVLRVANSSYYNPAAVPISTVSRAVIVLGFDTVRSICLSAAVVEALAASRPEGRVLEELARAVHAAVQAKALEEARGGARGEEVFIAALLHRLGHMVFWWRGGESAERLARALEEAGREAEPAEVERAVLGFGLDRLTAALGRSWRLGTLVEAALDPGARDPAARIARGSHALVAALAHGWESPEAQAALHGLAREAGIAFERVARLARESARHAEETARALGGGALAAAVARTTCAGPEEAPASAAAPEPAAGEETAAPWVAPEPDPALQLRILRELAALLDERPNVVLMLEMVLEALHRGVGMDRALFALLTPDRRFLRAKHAVGADAETLRHAFRFPLDEPNAIVSALEAGGAVLVDPAADDAAGLTPGVLAVTGAGPFCVMPLRVGRRAIGLLYADRRPSGRPIDAESFAAFRQFGQQANLGLAALELRRRT